LQVGGRRWQAAAAAAAAAAATAAAVAATAAAAAAELPAASSPPRPARALPPALARATHAPCAQARVALTALTIGLGALSSAGSIGISICVERDWTKALCGADAAALAQMNSVMRRIDLLALMLAPILSGLLMSYCSMLLAVVAIACYNAAAWLPEARLLRAAQRRSAELQAPKRESYEQLGGGPPKSAAASVKAALAAPVSNLLSGWGTYMRQPVLLPAVALAMLYFTVLSLGFLMTAFVKRMGLSELSVSLFRAAGALTGILATYTWPWLHSRLGILPAGAVGIGCQLLCLLPGVLPVLSYQAGGRGGGAAPAALLYVMMAGLAASRTGLWTFDLCVSQLLQDEVAQAELGGWLDAGCRLLAAGCWLLAAGCRLLACRYLFLLGQPSCFGEAAASPTGTVTAGWVREVGLAAAPD
jgi:iron-regulated transporter 1